VVACFHATSPLRARFAAAAAGHVRASWPLLGCLVFAISGVVAAAIPPGGSGAGVTLDSNNLVVALNSGSPAWAAGIRPGWVLVAQESDGSDLYSDGTETRPVAPAGGSTGASAELFAAAALGALLVAGLLIVGRQRRAATTAAVAGTLVASAIWAARLGTIGQAIAFLPVGLAAAMAWSVGDELRMWPWQTRRPTPAMFAAAGAVLLASAVAAGAAAAVDGALAGVVVGAAIFMAVAWVIVVWWRVDVVRAGPESLSRIGVAKAVAFGMLPYSDRVRMVGAQAERDKLASDLHAEVLPAIASAAAALEQRGAVHEAEQLRDLAASVRDLVSARRLPILDDHGLVAAAEWLAESLQERDPIVIEIDLDGDAGARRPQPVERAAYHVLQLALENVIRHAGATTTSVHISGDARTLDLVIADDGRGFDEDAAAKALRSGRLGFADMKSEADSVGASLSIAPRSPHGTVVSLRWRG